MRLNALIGEYEMNQVALDLGSEVNVLTKETWEAEFSHQTMIGEPGESVSIGKTVEYSCRH